MIIYVSLLVCIMGALVYALAANPKLVMLGIVAYGAGLLAFLECICHSGSAFGIVAR